MDILNTVSLESNSQIKINFDGAIYPPMQDFSCLKSSCLRLELLSSSNRMFKTNDTAWFRIHKDDANLMPVIYQIISAYFDDDCADELTNEPVMTAILDKDALASQPTLSRFYNRMDGDTLDQLNQIIRELRKVIYSIKKPEFMLFDIDSTLLDTYGNQEGEGFNYHYQAHGYHPLLCYDGLTGDLLKAELRGDSGFASPDLYEVLKDKNCKYAIRLKENEKLRELAEDENLALYRATKLNQVDYGVEYGEFMYQAGSWNHPRRVVFKFHQRR